MRDDHVLSTEGAERWPDLLEMRLVREFGIADAVDRFRAGRHRNARLHQCVKLTDDRPVAHTNRGDLDDLRLRRIPVGGLEVKGREAREGGRDVTHLDELRRLEDSQCNPDRWHVVRTDPLGARRRHATDGLDADLGQHALDRDVDALHGRDPDVGVLLPRDAQPRGKRDDVGERRRVAELVVALVQDGAELAHPARQQLRDEPRQRRMLLADGVQVLPLHERAANLSRGAVLPRQAGRRVSQLQAQLHLVALRFCLRLEKERLRQDHAQEGIAIHDVVREGDHTSGGEHVGDHRVIRERASLGEAAGNARVEEGGFEPFANCVLPVEERHVAPAMPMLLVVAPDVLEHPRFLGIVRVERERRDRENGDAVGARSGSVTKDRRVGGHELARQREHRFRTAVVLSQVNDRRNAKVLHEILEDHLRLGAGP